MASSDAITVYKGEDITLTFTMTPVEDITGWTLLLTVRNAGGVVFTKAGTITDAAGGVFTFSVADTDTEAIYPGAYNYDVWRTTSTAERCLALGTFTVTDVARAV